MSRPKIFAHGSYIGNTGYNHHTRDFLRRLSSYCDVKVRNFTVGSTWEGYNLTPHDKEPYINDIDKNILPINTWKDKFNRKEVIEISGIESKIEIEKQKNHNAK